jgi:hypothetical protein
LFYGYARQAVSILPVFFVMIAVAADHLMAWIAPRTKPSKSLVTIVLSILALGIVLIDVVGSLRRPGYATYGPIQMTPQWGAGAFECPRRIELHRAAPVPP